MQNKGMKQDSYAARVLLNIEDGLDNFFFTLSNSHLVMKVGVDDARTILWRQEESRKKRAIKYLQNKKLIKIKRLGNKYQTILTDDGIAEYFRLKVLRSDLLPNDKVTMVVFDIPESQSNSRKQLRRFLDHAGFMPIQKSVWISPFDAGQELAKLFKVKGKNGWIKVFVAKQIR
ncbi:TPA: hypothetical protein DDY56_04475 [Candidatus Uhrbacteria bacterium]|nr:MAG: hypothetical protein A2317_00680 [Candidatus Uhrbacteria bacterium RIFOXYB2_FULL_41_10]HAL50357.1 hypothetical protein [Candidatus Uhrbacteria bacterium]HAN06382.1 hypothetical protein [Candidatus Uhrbacteria bacterium]HAP65718.1 hypothetical protein [Candidatus Uhrbacteria bacterium]HBA51810.1 hypothetical protein [Candidatus Uhrbacteria bacterium]